MDAVCTTKLRDDGRSAGWKFSWLVPCVFLLASVTSLSIDVPFVLVFENKQLPALFDRQLKELLKVCEAFGHGFGATLIIIAVAVLAPGKRRCLLWLIAGSLGSGMTANIVKLTVHRIRPRDFDLTTGTVWDTFDGESNVGMAMQSFPSAHTATAVGLAVMLSSLFPRGRWLFSMMAILVGMQRIVASAHFPSDVFAGAAVGWLVAKVCVRAMNSRGDESISERCL